MSEKNPVLFFNTTSNPDYSYYIYLSRYSRWRDDLGRRETWPETVRRYFNFWEERHPWLKDEKIWKDAEESVLNLNDMPSMRALMTAGTALERDHIAGFNCSALAVDNPRAFDEALYVLCCGTGLGFSVERQHVQKLPEISEEFNETETTITVRDSKIGWATAYKELIGLLYQGQIPKVDYSKIRPAGARLKTFGGRASGPDPLKDLFKFTTEVFRNAAGRKLTSLECHDLMCKVADIVVVGGVRRSALISLSNLSDERMQRAKMGEWWASEPQRALANNSVAYTEKPEMDAFMREFMALYESKSGERGIFNREGANKFIPDRRKELGYTDFLCNPCSEILLRNNGLCNLTEVVVRPGDSLDQLKKKIKIASLLGTLQSTLTDFRYVRSVWKRNAEEERLLGVSLTGIMDHPILNGSKNRDDGDLTLEQTLEELKNISIKENEKWAKKLNINPATAVTTVKPSGTVSQLVDSSSGVHARYAPYYVRRVRSDKKDPVSQLMVDTGVPHEEDVMNQNNWVFSFPVKAPENALFGNSRSAVDQLEFWKKYKHHYTEHNPSVTISVDEDEWLDVAAWVYKNFDYIVGVSFLPKVNHVYKQAPYEEINAEEYEYLNSQMPNVDWTKLVEYENYDMTENTKELACTAGSCEI